jgi:hypothetical protein
VIDIECLLKFVQRKEQKLKHFFFKVAKLLTVLANSFKKGQLKTLFGVVEPASLPAEVTNRQP